jgi:hypothetical protein
MSEAKPQREDQEEIVARTMGFMYMLDKEKNKKKQRKTTVTEHEEENGMLGISSVFFS